MVKYFTSRLIYFQEPKGVKIKPESEISSHITPTSVISGLFHTRYLHWSSFAGNSGVKLAKTHSCTPGPVAITTLVMSLLIKISL